VGEGVADAPLERPVAVYSDAIEGPGAGGAMIVEDEALASALREAVARACEVSPEQVDLATPLDDLGLDSLAAAEVITDLEITLGVEFPVDVLRQLTQAQTVGDVLDRLRDGLAVPG
jgi:acyl carrier protein